MISWAKAESSSMLSVGGEEGREGREVSMWWSKREEMAIKEQPTRRRTGQPAVKTYDTPSLPPSLPPFPPYLSPQSAYPE